MNRTPPTISTSGHGSEPHSLDAEHVAVERWVVAGTIDETSAYWYRPVPMRSHQG